MKNLILVLVLACILGLAAMYLYRAKKSGKKCVGCPYADACGGKCGQEKI